MLRQTKLLYKTQFFLLFVANFRRIFDAAELIIHKQMGWGESALCCHLSCEQSDWEPWWLTSPRQSADHLSAAAGAARFQMPRCVVPRQWAQCWAIIPCVSRDRPPVWRRPLVCIHATLRSIIRWACQFPNLMLSGCYKYRASFLLIFAFALQLRR